MRLTDSNISELGNVALLVLSCYLSLSKKENFALASCNLVAAKRERQSFAET